MSSKWKGIDEIGRKLAEMEEATKKTLSKRATGIMARVVRDEAIKLCWVAPKPYYIYLGDKGSKVRELIQPGVLRDAIIMKNADATESAGFMHKHLVVIRSNAQNNYIKNIAHFVEYGTSKYNHIPQRPFLRPALDKAAQEGVVEAKEAVMKGLREVWDK